MTTFILLSDTSTDDSPCLYFTGNSLGLQAKESARLVKEELDTWASLGVLGHHYGKYPWVKIEDVIEQDLTHILGALPHELTCMTTLTTNLHLALISFYRPKEGRTKILMEWNPFPSDRVRNSSTRLTHLQVCFGIADSTPWIGPQR